MEVVNQRLELARVLYDDAQLLLAHGRARSAASRAYYSVYHACVALMESLGRKPSNYMGRGGWPASRWEHGIITANVATDPRASGILGMSIASQVRWLYLQRIRSDYRPEQTTSGAAAQTSVGLAQQILSRVEGHLNVAQP